MSKNKKRNPDHVRGRQRPSENNAAIEERLHELLTPAVHGQLSYYRSVGYFGDTPEPYGDLGEIVTGTVPGRGSPEERTLSLNLGLAIEDVATALLIYKKAVELGVGVELPL